MTLASLKFFKTTKKNHLLVTKLPAFYQIRKEASFSSLRNLESDEFRLIFNSTKEENQSKKLLSCCRF